MSVSATVKALTPPDLVARKGKEKIACLTAYTTPMARLVDRHCDLILVGDSVGMVVHGLPNTLGVTMDMMMMHGKAVMRGAERTLVVVDMPFGSYEAAPVTAFENAARLMAETGCGAVKLEGGVEMAGTVEFLASRGIPVMAHIGLVPQRVQSFGGYKVQGRGAGREKIAADARAVADAGAFAVVLEKVIEPLARDITAEISVPTIGIGASPACDGQILVIDDILGVFTDFQPKFVRRYAQLGNDAEAAISAYAADVREGRFPAAEHCFVESRNKT
ncbi:3-methyl-2-oxobutanoate hydroxymethyltransferase [Aureimonas fodinaquatilis]|uniref:3-methyl-2-oxobutanoate hydroxymethyltransferase n=1 Tax=Aureimonas fodinaquatilis TaxID=2565783 RepID=A0A5B0DV06_9HYPH|nr:3-methyl-2-oxobutanoate hydroxymethyltransferase [Aureimonas fodinaquatilis]KAA0969420.1 3-methyl-2-oxobutanoate hydroxymethyltransferase [Aureimonas fodinaquatilis]